MTHPARPTPALDLDDLKRSLLNRSPDVHGPAGLVVHAWLVSEWDPWVNQAIELIQECILTPVAVPSFARKYHLHASSFANDVCQETQLKVWRKRWLFDPCRGTLNVWVMTIARSAMQDFLRKHDVAQESPEKDPKAPSDNDDDDALIAAIRQLHEVLERWFTPADRALLWFWVEYQGDDWTAAAIQRLGLTMSPAALRVRLHRLKDRLRRCLLLESGGGPFGAGAGSAP